MVEKAKKYATEKHRSVNQTYDTHEYAYHLAQVFETAQRFIHLIDEADREDVLAACWVHDIIEDARETYNDVKKETNETIAELAYALTNEKGRTRAERANEKYYAGIRNTQNASFVKFCDRIANVQYAKESGSRMFQVYKEENANFVSKVYVPECKEIADYLREMFRERA